MTDDQFTEMKIRINRLLKDNEDLMTMNAEMRAIIVRLKVQHTIISKRNVDDGPTPDLGIDLLRSLIDWYEKPDQCPLGEIVERARITLKTIEDRKITP